jgi:hypothetical protein
MPTGIYQRKLENKAKMLQSLALGRLPEARKKAIEKIRELAKDENWRLRVSLGTKIKMQEPGIRRRHLNALRKIRERKMIGCNGAPLTDIIKKYNNCFYPLGYIREYVIKTRGHGTVHNPPLNYKADFAHPGKKIVVELDGPCHSNMKSKMLDKKKTEVLEALGWKVIRIKHK